MSFLPVDSSKNSALLSAIAKAMTRRLATNRSLLYNKNRQSLWLRKLARTMATALTTTFLCFQHTSGTVAGATAAWIASNDLRAQQSPIARVRKPTASHRLIRTCASFSESSSSSSSFHPPSWSFLEEQMAMESRSDMHLIPFQMIVRKGVFNIGPRYGIPTNVGLMLH